MDLGSFLRMVWFERLWELARPGEVSLWLAWWLRWVLSSLLRGGSGYSSVSAWEKFCLFGVLANDMLLGCGSEEERGGGGRQISNDMQQAIDPLRHFVRYGQQLRGKVLHIFGFYPIITLIALRLLPYEPKTRPDMH